jgi:hypothetical protein
MIASVLISAVSFILLVYWFRYSCLLLLTANPADKQADAVARANRLGFLQVQHTLGAVPCGGALDELYRALDSDYRILAYLLENSTGLDMPGVERRMLMLDYRVMRLGYRILRRNSPDFARKALLEMSQVLGCFSQKMGERTAQHAVVA